MTSNNHAISLIKRFEQLLMAYNHDSNPQNFSALQELIIPILSEGKHVFFDHLCTHATTCHSGTLLPAFFNFMDSLTREGFIVSPINSSSIPIQSACLLSFIYPENESHDVRMLSELDDLRKALALCVGCSVESVSLAPLALDLRKTKPNYELFSFCAIASQFASLNTIPDEAFNNHLFSDARFSSEKKWVALSVSFAFEGASPKEHVSAILQRAIGNGVVFSCAYKVDNVRYSAVIELQSATDPFSCCAKAFEPEVKELSNDLKKIAQTFDLQKEIKAILEPQAPLTPGIALEVSPLAGFGLSILHQDGDLLDAIWLPAYPESLALAYALLEQAGVMTTIAPVRAYQTDKEGSRMFMTMSGPCLFDPSVWRHRVLGVNDLQDQP